MRGSPPKRWLRYVASERHAPPLDPTAYRSVEVKGRPTPRPDWVCRRPDGVLHLDRRVGRVDVELAEPPDPSIEITSTAEYGVRIVARSWLAQIEDLVAEARIFVGEVRHAGRVLPDWVTLNQPYAPPLLSTNSSGMRCPICGAVSTPLWGQLYFEQADVVGRPLIVNPRGVYVRADVAARRKLRRPAGSFRPETVKFDLRRATISTAEDNADMFGCPEPGDDGPDVEALTSPAEPMAKPPASVWWLPLLTAGFLAWATWYRPAPLPVYAWLAPLVLMIGWAFVLYQWSRTRGSDE